MKHKKILKNALFSFMVIALFIHGVGCSDIGGHEDGISNTVMESPFGFHPAEVFKQGYSGSGYSDAQNIGVQWHRPAAYALWCSVQPNLDSGYEWDLLDREYSSVPSGIHILANITPDSVCSPHGYMKEGSYMPIDETKYTAFVRATVERYDGDGVDDMPGLTNPIKYWQVDNEPPAQRTDFAYLQKITYNAIKEACPDCTVLIGGVPGQPPVNEYITNFDLFYKPILDDLGGNYVDVMDFHWYGEATGDYRGAKEAYEHIRSVLNADGFPPIPFWITEMGSYSGDPSPTGRRPYDYPPQTERQQAIDFLKRFVYPLSFGVKKIFPAFGLMEGFKYDGGYFDYTGLIYDGWDFTEETACDLGLGVKKLGYYTYKKMTEMLEGSDWNNIQTIQESGNVYIYKFVKNGSPIYVAWWDYFNDSAYTPGKTMPITLSGLQGASAVITEAVPKFATGQEVTDYSTAFTTTTLTISNGAVTLELGDSPVFVEILQ